MKISVSKAEDNKLNNQIVKAKAKVKSKSKSNVINVETKPLSNSFSDSDSISNVSSDSDLSSDSSLDSDTDSDNDSDNDNDNDNNKEENKLDSEDEMNSDSNSEEETIDEESDSDSDAEEVINTEYNDDGVNEKDTEANEDDVDCLYQYDELVEEKDVDRKAYEITGNDRMTDPQLTHYEKIRLLGIRSKQIAMGAKVMVKYDNEMSAVELARYELNNKTTPLIIKRQLPDNSYELWKVRELIIDNDDSNQLIDEMNNSFNNKKDIYLTF